MTFVELFAGVGGFSLALEPLGLRCIGQCEIDPVARSVLDRDWPDVPKHDDVQTIRADTFGYPDVVAFGSPCQDVSQAGFRAGIKPDSRSGLFLDAIRYIEELQEASGGQYPKFVVWENVVGALHTNKGADYRTVLSAFLQAEVPVPRSGRWAPAGLVRGGGRAVVWRVLDAQHFGLAQRRRRLFVVVDLGGYCPGEVLLEREGVPGDPPASRAAREDVVGTLEARTTGGGFPGTDGAASGHVIPVAPFAFKPSHFTRGKDGKPSHLMPPMMADADKGDQEAVVLAPEPIPFDLAQITHPANRTRAEPGMKNGTLAATGNPHVVVHSSDGVNADPITVSEPRSWTNEGTTFRLRNVVQRGYRVRRLTPLEGERLMGFPEGHTAFGVKGDAEVAIADTPRFRLIGNSLAVPVVRWIGERLLKEVEKR